MTKSKDQSNHTSSNLSQKLGLHPLVGFGMVAVDTMLFTESFMTMGAGWVVTVPVALALSIPCVLIQKNSFGDNWSNAIGKGILVGLITAIPTPLPSIISAGGGVLGAMKMLMSRKDK